MDKKHIHHIIPRHAGGSNDPSNLVSLSINEHAEAHRKLWEETGNELDFVAWKALSGQIGSEEARVESLRIICKSEGHKSKLRKPKSIEHRKKMLGNTNGFTKGHVPHNVGKKITEYITDETRKIMSDKLKGNKRALGYKHTFEAKQKMRGPRPPLSEERKKQNKEFMKEFWRKKREENE